MSLSTHVRLPSVPVLWLALPALLLAAGCSKSPDELAAEAAIRAATGHEVKVERDGDQVTFNTDQGEMRIAGGDDLALPDAFPDDIYLPPDYRVTSVMDMGGTHVVSLSTRGRANALFEEARGAMEKSGWRQTMAMQHDADNAMLAFEKGERATVLSFNGADGGEVQVGVQLRDSRQ
ncbi:hypothetical protein [Lysobacter sp. A3-1-A15]|uniref:hypothetical protein n=1 Tax=Novilysobacter viscosus TaxID=3098602 RepID=UPI002ED9B960